MRQLLFVCLLSAIPAIACAAGANTPATAAPSNGTRITIRTESYPRPPYSGATYYIYERGGKTICTKLEVCNKFDQCERTYRQDSYKDDEDVQTGAPYGTTPALPIPDAKLRSHVCLVKFHLVPG